MTNNIFSGNDKDVLVASNLIAVYDTYATVTHETVFIIENRDYFGAMHLIDGFGEVEIGGHIYPLKKNSLFFGHHKDIKRIKMLSDSWNFHCYWFTLHNCTLPCNTIYELEPLPDEKELTHQIVRYLHMDDFYATALANTTFNLILLRWLKVINAVQHKDKPHYQTIQDAVFYINENIGKPLTIADISQHFGFCERHFRKLFHEQIGIPPKQYIDKIKMERAVELLKNTPMTVNEISSHLNYSSSFHFINAFKEKNAISPLQFRKKFQKNTLQ